MILRYRVLQARWPEKATGPGTRATAWQNWGFFFEIVDGGSTEGVYLHHNMDELHWIVHHITHRLTSRNLPLSRVEEAIAKYSEGFHAQSKIHSYDAGDQPLSAAINAVEARVLGLDARDRLAKGFAPAGEHRIG